MKHIRNTCLIFVLLVLNGCSSDDGFSFSGITMVDEFAVLVGEADETDWRLDDVWSAQELSLFPAIDGEALNNNGQAVTDQPNSVTPAYPNPNNGNFSFSPFGIDFENAQIVFVNSRYEILMGPVDINPNSTMGFSFEVQSQTASLFQSISPEISPVVVQSGQIVRAYYYFKLADEEIYLKGHGDILFQ